MTDERYPAEQWTMAERSIVPSVLGVSPLVAVAVEIGLTVLGVLVDLLRAGTLGLVFTILYVAGCVLAVAWVRRDGMFGPMVAPPLLLAAAVPAVVLLAGTPKPGAGMAERLLVIGAPLVNAFPTMAWTTAAAVAVGLWRMVTQRVRRTPSMDKKPADRLPTRPRTDRAGSERAGSERAGSERAGSERAGSERAGSERAGSERAGSERAGSERAGSERAGSERAGSERAGSEWAGSEWAGSERAKSERVRSGRDAARAGARRSASPPPS